MTSSKSPNDDLYLLDAGQSERGGHNYGTFAKCPQLWAYFEFLLDEPEVQEALAEDDRAPLTKGSMLHAGGGHHYEAIRRDQQGIESPLASIEEAVIHCAAEYADGPQYVGLVMDTLNAYAKHQGKTEARRFKVLAVEEEVRAFVRVDGRKELITARLDLVLQDRQLRTMVVDHKTRTWGNPATMRGYANGMQTLLLEKFGRKKWPDTFFGVYLNLIQWPRETKTKTWPAKFSRELVPTRPAGLDRLSHTLSHTARGQRALVEADTDPWEYPKMFGGNGTCEHRYGACPFVRLCNHGRSTC